MSHTEAYVSCVVYKARDNNCCYTNIICIILHACIILHCPLCTIIISCPCVNQLTLNLGLPIFERCLPDAFALEK